MRGDPDDELHQEERGEHAGRNTQPDTLPWGAFTGDRAICRVWQGELGFELEELRKTPRSRICLRRYGVVFCVSIVRRPATATSLTRLEIGGYADRTEARPAPRSQLDSVLET